MLDDALAYDRLIAMALLAPGWESDYEGRPPVSSTVCVGRIVTHQPTGDGRQNVLLVGVKRARIIRELEPLRSYREAEVELLDDEQLAKSGAGHAKLQRRMLDFVRRFAPSAPDKENPFETVLAGDVPLGMLTDIVTYMLPLDLSFKECMLAETNVDRRARRLLAHLDSLGEVGDAKGCESAFPPQFSVN
jgi:ATP-dependent Lon protease